MIYIIDANNLAGKLKTLGEENFDKKLIERIWEHNKGEQKAYTIVFDGQDSLGDKIVIDENITVIYSPKDKFYKNADDKIVEMVERVSLGLGTGYPEPGSEEVTVITDDVGLRKRIEKVNEERRREVKIIRATLFADKLLRRRKQDDVEEGEDGRRGLSEEEIDDINRELIKQWQ